jgi:hypothetical protein
LVAGIATLAAIALAAGVIIVTHRAAPAPVAGKRKVDAPSSATAVTPSRAAAPDPGTTGAAPPVAASLSDDFARLESTLHMVAGIVVGPVGTGQAPRTLGHLQRIDDHAWSTIKVPLVIAALGAQNSPVPTPAMRAAITESDNAAAESIWEGLGPGDPALAAQKVEAVLRQNGDTTTTVEWKKVRPEFTAFGQTHWPLTEQVRFTSAAWCEKASKPVFDLMGQIEQSQSWGIGSIAGARFKGGWGPSPTGNYLVRQIGVVPAPNGSGMIAVALAAEPESGKFDDGTEDLNRMSAWLQTNLEALALPAGQCSS